MKIIVESGATKTTWCSLDVENTVRKIETEGVNITLTGEGVFNSLMQKAVTALNPAKEPLSEIVVYAAGLTEPKVVGNVSYASDMLGAARSLCGRQPGIVAVMGTGSNSCLYDGESISSPVYSGGYILGDEGSAACLGKRFLADFIKNLVPETIASAFRSSFKTEYSVLLENVYKSETPSRYLGSLAPWIISKYDSDEYVRGLVTDNIEDFFRRSLRNYDCTAYPLGIVGSFADACRDILPEIARKYNFRISSILKDPLEGLIEYHKS